MSRSNDILSDLQTKLFMKHNKLEPQEEMGGVGFVSQYPADDEYTDVPDQADETYVTNKAFDIPGDKNKAKIKFKKVKNEYAVIEQEDDPAEVPPGPELPEEPAAEPMAGGMGEEIPGAGEMGADMGGGFGVEEEPKTAGELGRIYELKKIYARLTSLESYLANESDPTLLKIRNLVSQSIELFEVVAANFDSYKEKLDEIIITYYKFLTEVYSNVKDQFKKQNNGD